MFGVTDGGRQKAKVDMSKNTAPVQNQQPQQTTQPSQVASPQQAEIFNKIFLGKLKKILNEKCVPGAGTTVTREDACGALGLDPSYQSVISTLVNSGAVEGFELRRGPWGGIGRVGEKRPPGSIPGRTPKSEMFSDEFLNHLRETLERVCEGEKFVTRRTISKEMGMPGSEVEQAISLAISTGKIPGYETKRGAGGGIRREQPEKIDEPTPEPPVEDTAENEEVANSGIIPIFKPRKAKEKKVSKKQAKSA